VGEANMHLPGRQVDPDRVRRDIARLRRWEQQLEREPIHPGRREQAQGQDPDNIRAA
jgi:hypothetical protein